MNLNAKIWMLPDIKIHCYNYRSIKSLQIKIVQLHSEHYVHYELLSYLRKVTETRNISIIHSIVLFKWKAN